MRPESLRRSGLAGDAVPGPARPAPNSSVYPGALLSPGSREKRARGRGRADRGGPATCMTLCLTFYPLCAPPCIFWEGVLHKFPAGGRRGHLRVHRLGNRGLVVLQNPGATHSFRFLASPSPPSIQYPELLGLPAPRLRGLWAFPRQRMPVGCLQGPGGARCPQGERAETPRVGPLSPAARR